MPNGAACFADSPRWGRVHLILLLNLNILLVLLGCLCRRKVNRDQNKKNDVLEKKVLSFSIVDSTYISLNASEAMFNERKPV